ncbi:MAG: alpha/beta hydrolase [Acidimicrobiia bacterium]|nr:alpha/beta hydrolase [Acidimicrobiia bacterium]
MKLLQSPARPDPLPEAADSDLELAPPVRVTRDILTLDDGHRVGVAVAGRGVPFVVVHGFGVESLLYAQALARLAALGLQVVAIDVAGHGDTQRLGGFPSLHDYTRLLERSIDGLGIRRAILAGHSMGGRLVAEVAADRPEQTIGVVLMDAILGESWERLRTLLRWSPPALLAYGTVFLLDTAGTVPIVEDVRQALKLGSRVGRSVNLHFARPWRALAPGQAILRAERGDEVLDRLRESGVAVAVAHGDRDLMVPYSSGRDAAKRSGGDLVRVRGGSHSWLLRCPETLPAIVGGAARRPARCRARRRPGCRGVRRRYGDVRGDGGRLHGGGRSGRGPRDRSRDRHPAEPATPAPLPLEPGARRLMPAPVWTSAEP